MNHSGEKQFVDEDANGLNTLNQIVQQTIQ